MKFRKLTAGAVLVVAAMGLGAGTSYAAPSANSATPSEVHFDAKRVGNDIVTHVVEGTFAIAQDGKSYSYKYPNGTEGYSMGLMYRKDILQFPVRASLSPDAKTITFTPSTNPLEATINLERHQVASNNENLQAYAHFSSILGIAMAVGGLVGMGIGAAAGCIIGIALPPVPCLTGLTIGAAVGSVVGTVAAGGPALIAAGTDLIETLNAAPGTTRYARP